MIVSDGGPRHSSKLVVKTKIFDLNSLTKFHAFFPGAHRETKYQCDKDNIKGRNDPVGGLLLTRQLGPIIERDLAIIK